METAKVDIQKLQLLNDRIAQCFDALNQVRLSVHGLSHTSAQQGQVPQGFAQSPYQQNPYQQNPFPQNPYLAQGIGGIGLSHSTFGGGSYAPQPFGMIPQPTFVNPYEVYAKPLWADPILAARVAQTFPFVQLPITPVGIGL